MKSIVLNKILSKFTPNLWLRGGRRPKRRHSQKAKRSCTCAQYVSSYAVLTLLSFSSLPPFPCLLALADSLLLASFSQTRVLSAWQHKIAIVLWNILYAVLCFPSAIFWHPDSALSIRHRLEHGEVPTTSIKQMPEQMLFGRAVLSFIGKRASVWHCASSAWSSTSARMYTKNITPTHEV